MAEVKLPLPEITLIGTFSRANLVKPWFLGIYRMKLPYDKIHLILFDNTKDIQTKKLLTSEIPHLKKIFLSVTYHKSNRTGGRTILGQDNSDFNKSKLKPTYLMWKDILPMIKTDIFMQIEDDTIAPVDAFPKLLKSLLSLDKAGFVTAIETGRDIFEWSKVGLGVHFLWRKGNKITKRINPSPDTKGIIEIDASGVYCFVAYTKAWRDAFEGYDDYVADMPFFGMDLVLTNNMKRLGYKLYADFDLWCDHLQHSGGKLIAFNKKQAVAMGTKWIPEFNNYCQGVEIKK